MLDTSDQSGGRAMSGAGPPMAGGGGEAAVASSLPLPSMKTYGLYTDENVRRGVAPPPPAVPPSGETYSMFGSAFCMDDPIIQPLEAQVGRPAARRGGGGRAVGGENNW